MSFQLIGLNLVAVCMCMSTFFTDSKLSVQLGTILLFFPVALMFYSTLATCAASITAIFTFTPYYGEQWLQLGYILPHYTFGFTLLDFLVDHGAPAVVFRVILPTNMTRVWYANVATIFFYIGLYVYLDAVIPNKYGVTQDWCFCLPCKRKNKDNIDDEEKEGGEHDKMIEIRSLYKRFGKFEAVGGISLSAQKNQVLALLGHNGAGKTTTINMITGVLAPTEGDILVNGHSVVKNLD